MTPAHFTDAFFSPNFVPFSAAILPILTSMFVHGSPFHLIFNMWALWIFGDNVEDAFGHATYLIFYIVCGVAGTLLHIVANADSLVPMIGASGAIAGVMGAYLRLFPKRRVLIWWPDFYAGTWFQWVSSWIVLGWWILLQFLGGAQSIHRASNGGVAVFAHIGGFLAGMLFVEFHPSNRRYRSEL